MKNKRKLSTHDMNNLIKIALGMDKESQLLFMAEQLTISVYNYKLVNHSAIKVELPELVFSKRNLCDIYKNRKYLNKRMQYIEIIDDCLYFKDLPWESIINFLHDEMFCIITPPNYDYKSSSESSQNDYPDETKKLFSLFANTIASMQNFVVPNEKLILYKNFAEIVSSFMFIRGWKQLMSELIYDKLQPNDDVTKYFVNVFTEAKVADTNDIKKISSWLEDEKLPSILTVKNEKLLVSSAYENNHMALLPYIFCRLNSGYSDVHLRDAMVYACFHY